MVDQISIDEAHLLHCVSTYAGYFAGLCLTKASLSNAEIEQIYDDLTDTLDTYWDGKDVS